MRKIDALLAEYGESHQNQTNKSIHWICVPLIFFSVVGLIASIPSGFVQQILGEGNPYAYYVTLSIGLTVGMALFGLLCLYVSNLISGAGMSLWIVSLVVFALAWVGQFYGHKIEGKKPSFFKDLQFLLIGPAWLMHFIYKKLGIPY